MTRQYVRPALLVLALALVAALTGCAGAGTAQAGDCVEPDGDSFAVVDCAGAQLQVLQRLDGSDAGCIAVAGVTQTYSETGSGSYSLCLGPVGVDPATGINVAQVGDCLSGVDAATGTGSGDVRRVDCADPGAGAQVVGREESAVAVGEPCGDVAGTTASYTWNLERTSGEGPDLDFGDDLLFCLGPVGVDPATSADNAQVGDCLRETGDAVGYALTDCAAPEASLRVVERVEGGFLGVELACGSSGATFGVQRGGLDGYVLCMVDN